MYHRVPVTALGQNSYVPAAAEVQASFPLRRRRPLRWRWQLRQQRRGGGVCGVRGVRGAVRVLLALLEGLEGVLPVPEGAEYVLLLRRDDGDRVRDKEGRFLLGDAPHVATGGRAGSGVGAAWMGGGGGR